MYKAYIIVMSKRFKLFLILIVINSINSINETNLLTIIRTNFHKGLIIIFDPHSTSNSLYANLSEFGYSIILINNTMVLDLNYPLSGYLFLGFDPKLVQNLLVRPRANYLFHLNTSIDCVEITRSLHNVKIYNIHFIVNDKYIIPVRDHNCNFDLIETEIQFKLKSVNWNFHGCVVNVLTREWPPNVMHLTYHDPVTLMSNFSDGTEIRLARLIGSKLNYTIHFYSNVTGNPLQYQILLAMNPQYDMLMMMNIASVVAHRNFSYSAILGTLASKCQVLASRANPRGSAS